MLIRKITTGFVIQVFDTEKNKFISQDFTASDECDYEDLNGDSVESSLFVVDGKESYLSYDMVQPEVDMAKTRQIEMFICWDDYTWDSGHCIKIPADTPDDSVKDVAEEVLLKTLTPGGRRDAVLVGVYSDSTEDEDEDEDDTADSEDGS